MPDILLCFAYDWIETKKFSPNHRQENVMEKKDLNKVEDIAIRVAGEQMAKMYQPMGEHEDDKEARRAFYEGFQEGAAFYRLLISRIDDEFANLIEGARLDSGPEEDTHSVMEMCLKNGIPVITSVQKAPGKKETEKLHADVKKYIATVPLDMSPEEAKKFAEEHTTESEPEEPSKDDSAVHETISEPQKRVVKKFDIPVPETISEQQKMFAKKLEFPIEQAKAEPEKEAEEPKSAAVQLDPEGYPLWKHLMDKIEKVLENFGVKFERQGDENILYLRFKKGDVEYTIYFEKQEDGNYKVVFSDKDAHGGKVLCDGVIADSMALMAFEHSLAKHIISWKAVRTGLPHRSVTKSCSLTARTR